MATAYECKVITDTVDLNGKKEYTFKIEEPSDLFFYRSDMKLTCIKLDSSGSLSASKPGRIAGESPLTRDSKGKKIKISYEPDYAKTMPGLYRLEVVFKRNGRNGPIECTKTTEFRVVDSTPLAFVTKDRKVNCLIDLSKSRNPSREPMKLYLEGPRNLPVKLDICYAGNGFDSPCNNRNTMFTGSFNKTSLKLSGAGKQDEVTYYPGLSPRSGKVVGTANFGKTPKKLQYTFNYSDVMSSVLMDNTPIMQEQSIYVPLKHSLATSTNYRTKLKGLFSIVGPRHSLVEIKMNWNGYGCGHKHHLASFNRLAIGQFSGFTQSGEFWRPGSDLAGKDGIVDFRNIVYTTPGMCGKIKVVVFFKTLQNHPIDTKIFYLRIMYHGLKKLEAGENIVLDGETAIHPDNHYGTPELISAIKKIAKAYGEAYDRGEFNDKYGNKPPIENKPLYVNDMSLPYGGRFDCEHEGEGKTAINPFRPSHGEHMFGEEVDIQTNEMNEKQEIWFENNVLFNGFVWYKPEPEANHFHCSVVPKS